MKIDMSKARTTQVEIEGVSYTLRPMPFSNYGLPDQDENGEPVFTMKTAWTLFDGCLVKWCDKLRDEENKAIPVTRANKRYLFDYQEDIRTPLLDEINKINTSADEEVKNS